MASSTTPFFAFVSIISVNDCSPPEFCLAKSNPIFTAPPPILSSLLELPFPMRVTFEFLHQRGYLKPNTRHKIWVRIPLRSIYQECEFLIKLSWEMNPVRGNFWKCLKPYHGLTQAMWGKLGRRNCIEAVGGCASKSSWPRVRAYWPCSIINHARLCALSKKLQLRSAQQSCNINHRLLGSVGVE